MKNVTRILRTNIHHPPSNTRRSSKRQAPSAFVNHLRQKHYGGQESTSARQGCLSAGVMVFVLAAWLWATTEGQASIGTSLQMQLGNPSGATADTNNHNHYLVQRTVEALDF